MASTDIFGTTLENDTSIFRKTLADDCVSYSIYVKPFSADLSGNSSRSRLREILSTSKTLEKEHLSEYIWQREKFELRLLGPADNDDGTSGHKKIWRLYGSTEFGDAITDEWVVVWLLLELSRRFQDAWVRVYDADGEFLLAEAANALPKWLNPEVADHRVWINNGHLKIIPLDMGKSHITSSTNLTLRAALDVIERDQTSLIISHTIEDEAFFRIRKYPATLSENLHVARIILPRKIAYLLHRNPGYISPAIDAFYLRDLVSLRPLIQSPIGNLTFPPTDMVTVSVRFSRVGYAQIRGQEFSPPLSWIKTVPELSKTETSRETEDGMKVSCGFEMLIRDPQNQDKRSVREMRLLLDDVDNGEEALPSNEEILAWSDRNDDDSWLNVSYEDLEKELSTAEKTGSAGESSIKDKAALDNLRKMVESFQGFLHEDDDSFDDDDGDDDDSDDNEEDDVEEVEDIDGGHTRLKGKEPKSFRSDHASTAPDEDFGQLIARLMKLTEDETLEDVEIPESERIREVEDDDDTENGSSEEGDLDGLSKSMESELKRFGALDTDATSTTNPSDEHENDARYQLAKNLLESIHGQNGAPGPAGNLLKSFGLDAPKDSGHE